MNSPIPEPGALDPSTVPPKPAWVRGPRPRLLGLLIAAELTGWALAIAYVLSQGWSSPPISGLLTVALVMSMWLALFFKVWRGSNWARIALLVLFILMAFSALDLANMNRAKQVAVVVSTVLHGIWIWFLLSRPAIAFTKGVPEQAAQAAR